MPFQPNLDHLVLLVNERWPSNETMGWDDHLRLAEIIARSGNTATQSWAVLLTFALLAAVVTIFLYRLLPASVVQIDNHLPAMRLLLQGFRGMSRALLNLAG